MFWRPTPRSRPWRTKSLKKLGTIVALKVLPRCGCSSSNRCTTANSASFRSPGRRAVKRFRDDHKPLKVG